MKTYNLILLVAFAAALLYATIHLPERGDVNAPMHRDFNEAGGEVAGSYFIRNAYRDTATPNMVTVVLADYRSFDTLGEVVVVFAAGMACYLVLRRREER